MYVYHGSKYNFTIARPSYTTRGTIKNNKVSINYEGVSLHATPYKWIALSYIHNRKSFISKGVKKKFSVGVSLFTNDKYITIYGKKNLEYSLQKLYGNGGYLYKFDKKNFTSVKGLGPLEVISYTKQKPLQKIFIQDPVKEMKKLGVKFTFVDITKEQEKM